MSPAWFQPSAFKPQTSDFKLLISNFLPSSSSKVFDGSVSPAPKFEFGQGGIYNESLEYPESKEIMQYPVTDSKEADQQYAFKCKADKTVLKEWRKGVYKPINQVLQ